MGFVRRLSLRHGVLSRRSRLGVTLLAASLGASCTTEKPPRPQLVVHVDLDMPVTGQLRDDLSNDAAVDTVRVEVFTSDKKPVGSRLFSVGSAASLPLSFGIPGGVATDGQVLIRLRAFRAGYSTPGQQDGDPVLDPPPPLTVDRLVTLRFSAAGVVDASVVLHGDCFGKPVRFGLGGEEGHTCIDTAEPDALSSRGIAMEAVATSVAGTWSRAAVEPCLHAAPEGARCIPGGLSVFGDPLFLARNELEIDATPVKLVDHSPFFLDTHEVTVGELRALLVGGYAGPLPTPRDQGKNKQCSWDPAASGDLAVTCIAPEVADAVCAAKGGRVVSEAQWEHAARGRGKRRLFAWGDVEPSCCSASIARIAGGGCFPLQPEAVGSHMGDQTCAGDVTSDGIVDMTGGVAELVLDSIAKLDDPCWASSGPLAILKDPVCVAAVGRMARGAGWQFALGDAPLAVRRKFVDSDPSYGFRCVYGDGP